MLETQRGPEMHSNPTHHHMHTYTHSSKTHMHTPHHAHTKRLSHMLTFSLPSLTNTHTHLLACLFTWHEITNLCTHTHARPHAVRLQITCFTSLTPPPDSYLAPLPSAQYISLTCKIPPIVPLFYTNLSIHNLEACVKWVINEVTI